VIKFLCLQIKLGKITIEDVPQKYKDAVLKALEG